MASRRVPVPDTVRLPVTVADTRAEGDDGASPREDAAMAATGARGVNITVGDDEYAASLEAASRVLLAVSVQAMEALDGTIGPAQLRALLAVEAAGDCNVSELADELGVFPSSASRLTERLAAAGLMLRRTLPSNRREVRLALTPAGRRVVRDLVRRRRDRMARVVAQLSEPDRRRLLTGLEAFATAAGAVGTPSRPA